MEPPNQVGQLAYRSWSVAPRDARTQSHDRVSRRHPVAVPRSPPADRDLDSDSRLQQIQVGSVEEANFDEAHGAASIWALARVQSTA
jgi:hypothetical protein